MQRRGLLGAVAALSAGPMRGRAWGQAAKPASLSVMTWGGQFGDALARGGDAQFERQFGVKVLQDRGSSPGERITKVKINARNQLYDVMQLHDGLVPLAVQQGAYEKLDLNSPRLGNVRTLVGGFGNEYWVPFIYSEIGITYNTKEVAAPPTSWADLWRPEFKGRIVLPAIGHSVGPYIVPIGALAAGKDTKDEAAGFEQLKRLAELNPIWSPDTDGIMNAMASGEAVIGVLYRAQSYTLVARGAPVAWVAPKEGAISVSWGSGIAAGCRNRELAEEYINILSGPDCQVLFSEAFNYPGTNPQTFGRLAPALQERVRVSPESLARLLTLDQAFIAARRAAWTERWNRIVAG